MPHKNLESAEPSDWEQAKTMLQETGGWIKNADTKTTVLAAAFGVSLTLAVGRIADATPAILRLPRADAPIIWSSSLTLLAVAVIVTGWNIYRTLLPRIESRSSNRFAWPDVASGRAVTPPPKSGALNDAWSQIATLAKIAGTKYSRLRAALVCFGAYLLLLGWVLALAVTFLPT